MRWTGLVKLSGPGAPCVDAVELNVPPVVETKTKSLALLLVSCGKPLTSLRMKLYSPMVVMPPEGEMAVPSVNRVVPVMPANPAASRRFAAV